MGEKNGSSDPHAAREGPATASGFEGGRLKRKGSWTTLVPPHEVRRRETESEERGVAGREKSTAEEVKLDEAEG